MAGRIGFTYFILGVGPPGKRKIWTTFTWKEMKDME
jgi:hypothetical protein